ncbi:MAG: RICIN domain-containing protein [Sphingobacteriaceae bacterium]|nr:RICIN domain-containing protein [Sphingobacteriaceae bacterium]
MKSNFTKSLVLRVPSLSSKLFKALLLCSAIMTEPCMAQTSEAYNWTSLPVGGGGFVSGIITSKKDVNLMYARTDVGGAYRYDRAASKWIPLMDWASDQETGALGVEALATDFTDPKNVYASAGTQYWNGGRSFILRSTNYGASWTAVDVTAKFTCHGNGNGRQNGERLVVDPNKNSILFVGTRNNGLWKSTNFGVTWNAAGNIPVTTTPNGAGISFVVYDKNSAAAGATTTRMFVGVSRAGSNNNFYRSTDGGNTFTAIDNGALPDNLMPQRAVIPGNGFVYITYGNGSGPAGGSEPMDQGQIWKYNIATGAWTNITPLSSSNRYDRAFSGISVDPANANRLVATTINTYWAQGTQWGDRIFLSTDGGTNWTDIIDSRGFSMNTNGVAWISNSSIHWAGSIEFDPANTNRVFVTSGNGIFVNEAINTSNVWKFTVSGLEETVPLNLISIPGGPVLHVIGDYDGFRHTNVAANGSIFTPRMGTTTGLAYGATNKNKVVRVGSAMYYSNDMGLTWTQTAALNGGGYGQAAVSADGNTILHSPGNSSTTFRTTNNGSSWTTVSGLSIWEARPVADGLTSGKFYAYNSATGAFMISTNGGASFSSVATNLGSGGSHIIRTVPGRDGDAWVPLYNGGLRYTENSGTSFTNVSNVTYCGSVGIGKAATGATYETIYIWGTVNGVLGVHRSTNKGASWVRVNDDAHEYGGPANGQFVVGDMNTYGRVYLSSAGRGVAYGSATTTPGTTLSGTFSITARHSGKAIDVAGASMINGATIIQWPYNGGANQKWTINSVGSGYYSVTNVNSGQALDVFGGSVADGGKVIQYPYSGGTNQQWSITDLGTGYYSIINRKSGKSLDIKGAGMADGDSVLQWTYSGGTNQQFALTTVSAIASIAPDSPLLLSLIEPENTKVNVYPNPVESTVTISAPSSLIGGNIVITNTSGIIVFGGKVESTTTEVNLSHVPSGLYILSLKHNGKSVNSKIVKK